MTTVLDKSSLERFDYKRNKGDCRLESMSERVPRTRRGFNSRPRDCSPNLAVAQEKASDHNFVAPIKQIDRLPSEYMPQEPGVMGSSPIGAIWFKPRRAVAQLAEHRKSLITTSSVNHTQQFHGEASRSTDGAEYMDL
jgi:hypothetical protein